MEPLHITWAAEGRRALFPETAERLAALRVVARSEPLLFCVVDDHVHGVWHWRSGVAARMSGVSRALAAVATAPLQPGYRRRVEGRRHLETLVGYLARQPAKHGLGVHPATWIGSCVPDLLGARRLRGFAAEQLRAHLPRWRPELLAREVGLPGLPSPASDVEVLRTGWVEVAACAARAFGVPDLAGNAAPTVRARCALATLASPHPGGLAAIAHLLGATRRGVGRMALKADADSVITVRRAVALANMTALATSG